MPMLERLEEKAKYFLGDAYYRSVEILKRVKELKIEAIVPVRDTVHTRVRYIERISSGLSK